MDTLTPTKAISGPLPSSGTELRTTNDKDPSLRVLAEETRPEAQKQRVSSEAARIIGIRDSSGDRMDVRVDPKDGVVVRIVNESGDVIRQIPPEELVALARRLDEAIGFLFDKKA